MKNLFASAAVLALTVGGAFAADGVVKIGVLNDQSTSFSALGGTEAVEAVKLAIADFGGEVLGQPIEFVSADHQNKPDVALSIAREWLDTQGVDLILDVPNSAIALGLNTLIGESEKMGIFISPLTDRPTEADCNGHVLAWAYDAYSTVGTAVNAQLDKGFEKFFILSPDYEAGKVMSSWVETAVANGGGEVVGKVAAPLGTTDFSSFILQAQASGADVIQVNLNGSELINALKQIQEFGLIDMGQRVAVTFLHQSDARSIGAESLQGIQFAAPWFWTQDDESRAFGERMKDITGNAPGWVAAGNYSAATAYLNAVQAAGSDDPDAVFQAMQGADLDDMFVKSGELRPNGRLVHDMYLLEVRDADEVGDSQEYFRLEATVPADEAFQPLSASACPLVTASN
ncbi:ABC transporter substrate-binding protein [Oceanibium sediminis]|uniref:ABC transporter substrate-binding protein n=1 Tax=Oceanibium sediminis TaxID=2026339 RepID=UPI000DD3A947|nr:ABC transporter substrate-binding protein [Oceanibium sediminis]